MQFPWQWYFHTIGLMGFEILVSMSTVIDGSRTASLLTTNFMLILGLLRVAVCAAGDAE